MNVLVTVSVYAEEHLYDACDSDCLKRISHTGRIYSGLARELSENSSKRATPGIPPVRADVPRL